MFGKLIQIRAMIIAGMMFSLSTLLATPYSDVILQQQPKANDSQVSESAKHLIENLNKLSNLPHFIVGQQRATLSGIGAYGQDKWSDGDFGRMSDIESQTGKEVGLLGIDVWDLAMKNYRWNRDTYSHAIRQFHSSAKGGVITLDWHMRACDIPLETDNEGESSVPGWGFNIDDWNYDSNRSCLCRIVNEEPWYDDKTWKDWLFERKIDRFAQVLYQQELAEIPLIFRPYHEHNGNWFWWGRGNSIESICQ